MTDTPPHDLRTDFALCVSGALRGRGWKIPPDDAYAVADALLRRPGMLRAATHDGTGTEPS